MLQNYQFVSIKIFDDKLCLSYAQIIKNTVFFLNFLKNAYISTECKCRIYNRKAESDGWNETTADFRVKNDSSVKMSSIEKYVKRRSVVNGHFLPHYSFIQKSDIQIRICYIFEYTHFLSMPHFIS